MICLRCGYCCINHCVIVPKSGKAHDPNEEIREHCFAKATGDVCPNLSFDSRSVALCSIHGESWYEGCPCDEYTQIERSPSEPCRTGEAIRSGRLILREILTCDPGALPETSIAVMDIGALREMYTMGVALGFDFDFPVEGLLVVVCKRRQPDERRELLDGLARKAFGRLFDRIEFEELP